MLDLARPLITGDDLSTYRRSTEHWPAQYRQAMEHALNAVARGQEAMRCLEDLADLTPAGCQFPDNAERCADAVRHHVWAQYAAVHRLTRERDAALEREATLREELAQAAVAWGGGWAGLDAPYRAEEDIADVP